MFPALASVLLTFAGMARGAGSTPLGAVLGWGEVSVDRLAAPSGTLLFPGDVVTTAANSGAELRFLTGGVARVEPSSEVSLDGPPGELNLRRGSFTLRSPAGAVARARVMGARLSVEAAPSSTCRVDLGSGSVQVAALAGGVVVEGGGRALELLPGQAVRFAPATGLAGVSQSAAQNPPASSPAPPSPAPPAAPEHPPQGGLLPELRSAGRVVALYPDEVVRHPGDPIATPLVLGELVDDGDLLGTLGGGRVRVQLFDNSIFDLGAATTLRLVRHDPAAHSTALDLRAGYFHAVVAPASGPQPNFVVTTPFAEVSAAATMFFVSTDGKSTDVCNAGSGPLLVRQAGAANARPVAVAAGECSTTPAGGSPGPSRADRALLVREMALASFQEGPSVPVLARRLGIKKARTATLAGVSVLSLVTFVEMYQTSTNLDNVASDAQPYISALSGAGVKLGGAIELDYQLCLAFLNFANNFGKPLSPSVPSQACSASAP